MGYLLYKLLIEPVSRLSIDLLRKIRDVAFVETYELEKVKAELEVNEDAYDSGEISEQEYEKRKSVLMRRLELAERLEEETGKDRVLYESGRLTKEEFERRRSDAIDKIEREWRSKSKGKKK